MPPKGEATTFSFEIVACLIAAMEKNGQILGNKHFAMMARLDGSRSESGFQHLFRAVKRRGKEIAESLDDADATPKKAKKPAAPASSSKKRRMVHCPHGRP